MPNEQKKLYYNFERERQISVIGPTEKGRFLLQVRRPGEKDFCTCNLSLDEISHLGHSLLAYVYDAAKKGLST